MNRAWKILALFALVVAIFGMFGWGEAVAGGYRCGSFYSSSFCSPTYFTSCYSPCYSSYSSVCYSPYYSVYSNPGINWSPCYTNWSTGYVPYGGSYCNFGW